METTGGDASRINGKNKQQNRKTMVIAGLIDIIKH